MSPTRRPCLPQVVSAHRWRFIEASRLTALRLQVCTQANIGGADHVRRTCGVSVDYPAAAVAHFAGNESLRPGTRETPEIFGPRRIVSAEQPLPGIAIGAIAKARCGLESAAVRDMNPSACVADQPSSLQRSRSLGDTDPAHTKHAGEERMGDAEGVFIGAIVRHQQPACQPLFNDMRSDAAGGLRELRQQHEGIATEKPDRKSTRLNSSHPSNSYAVFCLKKLRTSYL